MSHLESIRTTDDKYPGSDHIQCQYVIFASIGRLGVNVLKKTNIPYDHNVANTI